MKSIQGSKESRYGCEQFEKFDIGEYAKQTFSMFSGKPERAKLLCDNSLLEVILERFGMDSMVIPYDDNHFTVSMDVEVSLQYLAWVIGLGSGAKVLSLENVVEQMKMEAKRLRNIMIRHRCLAII